MKKVSVIVPVFNAEKYLPDIFNPLLEQTLGEDLEIIVINDASEDNSQAIIDDYTLAFPDRIISRKVEKNSGAAHARNLGLEIASGCYVGFVDCDDQVDLSMFEKLYTLAESEDADIATCGFYRLDGSKVQRRDVVQHNCFGFNLFQAPSLLKLNVPYVWNKIFRKEFLDHYDFKFEEDLDIYEDLLFTYKAFLKANKVVRVSKTLYSYVHTRAGSLTYHFSKKRFQLFDVFERLIDFYKTERAFFPVQDELLYVFLVHVFAAFENDVSAYRQCFQIVSFFRQAIRFLNTHFPWWKSCRSYFKDQNKSQFLYTKSWFILLRSLRPKFMLESEEKRQNYQKRLSFSKPGMTYIESFRNKCIAQKAILIDSQRGANLSGNMFYILRFLLSDERYGDMFIGLTYRDRKARLKFRSLLEAYELDKSRIRLLRYNSNKYAEFLATTKYIFTDTSMPVYFTKRSEQIYLNTWHGTPLKCLGRDMNVDYHSFCNLTKNFLAADYLAFQSEYMRTLMEQAYSYKGLFHNKMVYAGYPRNEAFFDTERRALLREEFEVENQCVIGYMPTWRGTLGSVSRVGATIQDLLDEIDKGLDDNQVMYVNLHHYDASRINFDFFDKIRPYPKDYETYDVLNICDVLVTDYSSVMFDFAASRRKIVLFPYDYEEYVADRGVYTDLKKIGLDVAYSVEELLGVLRSSNKASVPDEFIRKYCPYENARASELLCRLVIDNHTEPDNMSVQDVSSTSKETTLLMVADFKDYALLDEWVECSQSFKSENKLLVISYNMRMLRNQETLKKLDESTLWFGVSYPFTATTASERKLLSHIDTNPTKVRFSEKLFQIMQQEWMRAYPNTRFDRVIVSASEEILNIIFASFCSGQKCLLITSRDLSAFAEIPRWVLKNFDKIYITKSAYEELSPELLWPNFTIIHTVSDVATL